MTCWLWAPWGDWVVRQLFWKGSKCPFLEASYCREDSPSSRPVTGAQMLGCFSASIPSPGLLAVGGEWSGETSCLAVQVGKGTDYQLLH